MAKGKAFGKSGGGKNNLTKAGGVIATPTNTHALGSKKGK